MKMKKMKQTRGGRLLAIVLVALMMLTALTGCGTAVNTLKPEVDGDAFLELNEDCSLSALELKNIAQMLASVYNSDLKTNELLVAAYRGHDMLAEDFDDSKVDPSVVKDPDMAAVVKVIQKANEKADADNKVLFDYTGMNETDALTVINSLKTAVALEAKSNFWDTLLGWIGVALRWLTNTLGGGYYIIGICIFAVIVEILMLPLSIKQQKNSIKQAKLRPKEMAIRKKYAGRDDQVTRQKVATEIQELYQRENFSAASGCLPLLIQLPIIMALYSIVVDPLHYVLGQAPAISSALSLYNTTARAAGGLGNVAAQAGRGTIEILSQIGNQLDGIKDFMLLGNGGEVFDRMNGLQIPDFTLGGVNLGAIPSLDHFNVLLLVPALTFVVYFLSMRLTKKLTYQPTSTAVDDRQAACSNWIMDITMPAMSTYIAFVVPALVGIYWIFKSVISTLRQFIVTRLMPYPKFTEEDYRAAEREYAGKAPRSSTQQQYAYGKDTRMVGGKPRSLFHMDDDDYVAKIEQQEREEKQMQDASKSSVGSVDGAALKQDDRNSSQKKKDSKVDDQ